MAERNRCRHCGKTIHQESDDVTTWWVHDDTGGYLCSTTRAEPIGD